MQHKNTLLAAILMLALAAVITIGSTLAYLTDTVEDQTSYTIGEVNIEVVEDEWGAKPEHFKQGTGEEPKAILFPGRSIAKNPSVVVQAESEDCYVRLKVTIEDKLAKVIAVPEPAPGWTRVPHTREPNTYYYKYNQKLTYGTPSPPAFEKVKVLANPSRPENVEHRDLLQDASGQAIIVQAHAIQAKGIENYDQAYRIMDSYFVTQN